MAKDDDVVSYDYDPDAATKADENASRIDRSTAYLGEFEYAEATVSQNKGTHGIVLGFNSPGEGKVELTLWTKNAAGEPLFGNNFLQALLTVLGLKGLKGVKGKVYKWNEETKKRRDLEEDGVVFPDLLKKRVGLFLQKELKTNEESGKDFFNMNIWGVFHPETRLTASEIREKKQKPEKFERMMKSIKDKDSRVKKAAEPEAPSIAGEGGY